MNKFDLMREAVDEAEAINRAADTQATRMARMLVQNNRLKNLPGSVLKDMKKQLANFNMATYRWK